MVHANSTQMQRAFNQDGYSLLTGSPTALIVEVAGEVADSGTQEFTPPYAGRNNDWVLILDDAALDLPRVERGDW